MESGNIKKKGTERAGIRIIPGILLISILLFLQISDIIAEGTVFNKNDYKLEIPKINSTIIIDGVLSETAWDSAGSSTKFWLHHPVDTGKAYKKTEIKMMYDEEKLYIGFICYGTISDPIVQSLKRDDEATFWNGDGISIVIDPANADKNGYYFAVNTAGSEIDGVVFQNGMDPSKNNSWSNKWETQVSRDHDKIFYEIAIPFSAIKYNDNNSLWGINFIRNDPEKNNNYSWTLFPAVKLEFDFGYNGNLFFKNGIPKSSSNQIIVMPSATSGIFSNKDDHKGTDYKAKGGLDAKVSVGSALNLDLSVYPDFSNVAVDQQYIDFYRYEYYMPEQRGFFLENNDLFASFGTYDVSPDETSIKPIYTRRLGIKDWENIPIVYGGRISGGLSNDLRIGLLNLHTNSHKDQKAQNYAVGAFQQGVLQRSAIKGIFTSRQAIKGNEFLRNDYNRTAGLEFDYSTEDARWTANAKFHKSFTPENYLNNTFYGGGFTYNTKIFKTLNWIHHVDKNYVADLGFIPHQNYEDPVKDTVYRFGYTSVNNWFEYYQFMNNDFIVVCGEYLKFNTYLGERNEFNEFKADLGYWSVFANNVHIVLNLTYDRFKLLVPYDVLGNDNPIPLGTYDNPSMYFLYESDPRQKFKYSLKAEYGKFYNGTKFYFTGGPSYTIQPYGTMSLVYSAADIKLAEGYGHATYHLFGGKSEIGFTTNILWTTLLQYNTQLDNMNINSILQWRYAPMSDIYFVLKDDFTRSGKSKKYEVSIKLTYWLDI